MCTRIIILLQLLVIVTITTHATSVNDVNANDDQECGRQAELIYLGDGKILSQDKKIVNGCDLITENNLL